MFPYRLHATIVSTGTLGSVEIPVIWTTLDTAQHYVEKIKIVKNPSPSLVQYYVKFNDGSYEERIVPFIIDFIPANDITITMIADDRWDDLNASATYIEFGQMVCEKHLLSKTWTNKSVLTGDVHLIHVASGQIRESSSIINPSITFEWEKGVAPSFNYVFIPSFGRYYFVNNITFVSNNLWVMSLSVDVLNSFKDDINDLPIYVDRSEFDFNPYIEDSIYPLEDKKLVSEYIPTNVSGFTGVTFSNKTPDSQLNILLVTMRGHGVNSAQPASHGTDTSNVISNPDFTNLPSLMKDNIYVLNNSELRDVQTDVMGRDWLESLFVSCIKYPFAIADVPSPAPSKPYVHFGDNALISTGTDFEKTVQAYYYWDVGRVLSKTIPIKKFKIEPAFNSFLDYEPYTNYEIYLPFKGWVTLNASQILNKTLLVSYVVNFLDGSAEVIITDETDNKMLYSGQCQLGVAVSLSTSNQKDVESRRTSMVANAVLGGIKDVIGMISSVGGGQYGKAGAQLIGTGMHANETMTQVSLLHEHGKCEIIGGEIGLYNPLDVRVRVTSPIKSLSADDVYAHQMGKPCKESYSSIGDFPSDGFIKGTVHAKKLPNATSEEIDMVESLIATGIIQ